LPFLDKTEQLTICCHQLCQSIKRENVPGAYAAGDGYKDFRMCSM